MKNKEIIKLYKNLNDKLLDNLTGVKLLYALDRNYSQLESEIKSLEKARKPSKEYKDYNEKRTKLNIVFCEKTKDGKPRTRPFNGDYLEYIIDKTKQKEYDEKMTALEEEYGKAIIEREKQLEEFDELLEEQSEFKPCYIDFNDLPKDIEWKTYQLIKNLIKKDYL